MVVLIMVIIDLLVLIVFTAVVGGLNLSLVERVTHRENPQTVEGVSIQLVVRYLHRCLCHFCRM